MTLRQEMDQKRCLDITYNVPNNCIITNMAKVLNFADKYILYNKLFYYRPRQAHRVSGDWGSTTFETVGI